MTAKNKTMESFDSVSDIGAILKKARLDAGLTSLQIAEKLRLKPEYVEALETNPLEQLKKNSTFTRGHLRGYARLLHIPSEQVDAALATLVIEEPAPLPGALIIRKNREFSFADKKIRWLTYAIGALLLILIIIWWRSQVVSHVSTAVAVPAAGQGSENAQTSAQVLPMIDKQIDAQKAHEKKEEHHVHEQNTPVKKLNMDMQG